MYSIDFSRTAKKELAEYKKSNPMAFKKIAKMLGEMQIHPREGTGHPEPLLKGNDIFKTYHQERPAHL